MVELLFVFVYVWIIYFKILFIKLYRKIYSYIYGNNVWYFLFYKFNFILIFKKNNEICDCVSNFEFLYIDIFFEFWIFVMIEC